MRKRTLVTLMACGVLSSLMLQSVTAKRGKGGGKPAPVPTLSAIEAADLSFMREEEKLARDVYTILYTEWGNRVFDNISQSEQKHMNSVLGLLDKYGLEDPALRFGKFADAELQALFDYLIGLGMQSELDALLVGALIEEVDMEDIVLSMARTDKADILTVYGSLLAGSENHLNAFVKNIEAITGETYVAQWILQEEVDAILSR